VTGTQQVNGTICTTGVASPHSVFTNPLTVAYGNLILFSHKGTMSSGSPQTIGATYSSATRRIDVQQSSNSLNRYEVQFATSAEQWGMRLWNAPGEHGLGETHEACVNWSYGLTTMSPLASEPNSDNLTGSIGDRTMGNVMAVGQQWNRNMFSYSTQNRDVEEWYKVTLHPGHQYRIDVGNYNGKYGTWKYRVTAYKPNGLQLQGMELQTTQTSASMTTATISTPGQYFIQLAGFQKTKNAGSNCFYSPYWIKVTDLTGNLPPTAVLEPQVQEILSGRLPLESLPAARVVSFSDPEGQSVSIRCDWNNDTDFDDTGEGWLAPAAPGHIFLAPTHYNNPTLGTIIKAVAYEVKDSQGAIYDEGAFAFFVGPNRKPYVNDTGSGTVGLTPDPVSNGQSPSIQALWGTIADPEGDPMTFQISINPVENLSSPPVNFQDYTVQQFQSGIAVGTVQKQNVFAPARLDLVVWLIDPTHPLGVETHRWTRIVSIN